MILTLDDFIREYTKICRLGWVKTHRLGDTGVGKTLEDLLGIQENNKNSPDFGDYELKSCRLESSSMLTLFTKTPDPKGAASVLRQSFGYISRKHGNDRLVLHESLWVNHLTSIANTGRFLTLVCRQGKVCIVDEYNKEYGYWDYSTLQPAFEEKYKNKLVYARAHARGKRRSPNEEFKFVEAYEVSGFDYDSFISLVEQGNIVVDLRIGQYNDARRKGKTHDHGTGFRITEKDQPLLFKIRRKIVSIDE